MQDAGHGGRRVGGEDLLCEDGEEHCYEEGQEDGEGEVLEFMEEGPEGDFFAFCRRRGIVVFAFRDVIIVGDVICSLDLGGRVSADEVEEGEEGEEGDGGGGEEVSEC